MSNNANVMQIQFLNELGLYALNNSITAKHSKVAAKVVTVQDMKIYLQFKFSTQYKSTISLHGSLEEFLMLTGRDMVEFGFNAAWNDYMYECMTYANYQTDARHDYGYLAPLNKSLPSHTLLFVIFPKSDLVSFEKDVQESQMEGHYRDDPMTDEIWELCHSVGATDNFYKRTQFLVKRIQNMLDGAWPNMQYKVAVFGSTANSLGLRDADVDLCIVVPEAKFQRDLRQYKQKLSKQPKTVYNMFCIANKLRSIGMKNVEAVAKAAVPICKFKDPQTGLNCDINTHNLLGIENTHMIGQYVSMDLRIRPFLTAIKHFVKQKDINSAVGGTLSSYAYVIMALHFLMVGVDTPLIPSLQKLFALCRSNYCKSKTSKQLLVLHNREIIKCDARYHDCVRIVNTAINEYNTTPYTGKNDPITTWESENNDTVSELVGQFFEYYADPKHWIVSIITEDGKLYGCDIDEWEGQPIIVQDPFILTKNLARSVTMAGANAILREFERAAKLMSGDVYTPFSIICDKRHNLNRPVDTESIEYRFKEREMRIRTRKQKKNQQQQQQQQSQYQQVDAAIGVLEENSDDLELWMKGLEEQPATVDVTKTEKQVEVIKTESNQKKKKKKIEVATTTTTTATASTEEEKPSIEPILGLVKKLFSYQPPAPSNGLAFDESNLEPCTDMQKLLEDPCMAGIYPRDISFLIAQLNHLGTAVAERMFSIEDGDSYEEEEDEEEEEAEEEEVAYLLTKENLHTQQQQRQQQRQSPKYNDNDVVDVYFYVENVPMYIDSYEIYQQFDWYGSVIEIKPAETTRSSITWHVHMQMRYKTFKSPLPIAVELRDSEDDVYNVTSYSLTPY